MISRGDFIFTIGYHGETAIVDGRSKNKYAKLSTEELAQKGLFKPALCSGLYEEDEEALRGVLEIYNRQNEKGVDSTEQMLRLFGVSAIPEGITKVMIC
jgi:hypothetical protein